MEKVPRVIHDPAELQAIALPKWPNLIVTGESVTPDQAAEIILRTNGTYFSSNDHGWTRTIYRVLGIPLADDDWVHPKDWDQAHQVLKEHGMLDLAYLINSQIASSYVNGAHGWMHWDGTIGCNDFNIGKWPNTMAVLEEWQLIAKTWPFLNMKSQLLSGEQCEKHSAPLVEYRIQHGYACALTPGPLLVPARAGSRYSDAQFLERLNASDAERGCTFEQLMRAAMLARSAHLRDAERVGSSGQDAKEGEAERVEGGDTDTGKEARG